MLQCLGTAWVQRVAIMFMLCSIGEAGAKALALSIARSATFRSLKAMYNELGAGGSQALMEAMQKSCTFNNLEVLFFTNAPFEAL